MLCYQTNTRKEAEVGSSFKRDSYNSLYTFIFDTIRSVLFQTNFRPTLINKDECLTNFDKVSCDPLLKTDKN